MVRAPFGPLPSCVRPGRVAGGGVGPPLPRCLVASALSRALLFAAALFCPAKSLSLWAAAFCFAKSRALLFAALAFCCANFLALSAAPVSLSGGGGG